MSAILRVRDHLRGLAGRWAGWVIAIVVGAQLLLPLHFYAARRDRHDERFAWRMFSPTRMVKCRPQFFKNDVQHAIGTEFHEAWVEIAMRGRFAVVEAMGARLCAKYPGSTIRVELTCSYLDKPDQTYGGYDMCQVPSL